MKIQTGLPINMFLSGTSVQGLSQNSVECHREQVSNFREQLDLVGNLQYFVVFLACSLMAARVY